MLGHRDSAVRLRKEATKASVWGLPTLNWTFGAISFLAHRSINNERHHDDVCMYVEIGYEYADAHPA